MELALEAKSTPRVTDDHLKSLRELKADFPRVRERAIVCLETQPRITNDGILIIPYGELALRLWANGGSGAITLGP
jgi:hypothetical protein